MGGGEMFWHNYFEFLHLMMGRLGRLFIPNRFVSLKHLAMFQDCFVAPKIFSSL